MWFIYQYSSLLLQYYWGSHIRYPKCRQSKPEEKEENWLAPTSIKHNKSWPVYITPGISYTSYPWWSYPMEAISESLPHLRGKPIDQMDYVFSSMEQWSKTTTLCVPVACKVLTQRQADNWKSRVVMKLTLFSLVATEVVIMTTSGAASDYKVSTQQRNLPN